MAIPMKAMMSHEPGGPETLKLTEVDTPEPGPGQIRIAVKASGVNFPDTLIIRDLYQFKPPRPFAPGGEVAGVVEAVGDGVDNFAVGDRVLAGGVNGGFATHFIANAAQTNKMPDEMPFDEAAAFMLTYGTSHYALKDRAAIKPGDSLFILGAAGGVGAAAIELGKAFGAKVVAGVSSEDKAAFCKELGRMKRLSIQKASLTAPRKRNSPARSKRFAAVKAPTLSMTPSAATTPSRRCGRSHGKDVFWWSVSRQAFRKSR